MTRTAFDDLPAPSLTERIAAAVRAIWVSHRNARQRRQTLRALHRLNDHHLRDVGLERDPVGKSIRRLPRDA